MTETLKIEGMSCDGCINSVRKALERLPLSNVQVKLGEARVEYDEKMVNQNQVIRAVEDAGFEVTAARGTADAA